MGPCHHRLCQQSGQKGGVELDKVREVHVQGVVQGFLHHGMAAAERVDAEAGEEVEIPLAVAVVQIAAFALDVETIKAQRLQHLHELGVEVLAVKAEVPPCRASINELSSKVMLSLLSSRLLAKA